MKYKRPTVSVIMPVYNAQKYLGRAIESILKQTFQDFELIIIDDSSIDKSWSIIQRYQKKYPQLIRPYHTTRNLNCGGDMCANEALQYARGRFIARMDADDIAHPTRLEKQVEFLKKNPRIFLVGTNAYVIDQAGTIIGDKTEPLTNYDIYRSYLTFHPIIHPSVMMRRKLTNKPFSYEIKFSANNDYYTFFKLLCKGYQFANLEEKLMYYRIHGKNDTFVKIKEKFLNTIKIRLIMIFKFGYQPTSKQVLISIAQSVLLLLLPEKIITRLYLISKGIIKIQNPLTSPTLSLFKVR